MRFSLGAILYEMASEQKACAGETPEQVRAAILEQTPPLPVRLKPNVNQGLSNLIMKAISKSPEERYQSGQELVRDLEQCKSGAATLPPAVAQKPKAHAAGVGSGASTSAGLQDSPQPKIAVSSASVAPAAPMPPPAKPGFAVDPMI